MRSLGPSARSRSLRIKRRPAAARQRERSASRRTARCGRLEGHGLGVSETASERDGLHARFRSGPTSNRNRASQRWPRNPANEMRFPVSREDGGNASPRCRQSAEAAAGSPSTESASSGAPRGMLSAFVEDAAQTLIPGGEFVVGRILGDCLAYLIQLRIELVDRCEDKRLDRLRLDG